MNRRARIGMELHRTPGPSVTHETVLDRGRVETHWQPALWLFARLRGEDLAVRVLSRDRFQQRVKPTLLL
jgi:hypothetical protein